MTAVAPPVTLQSNNRVAWVANGNGFAAMNDEEVRRMLNPGQRKTIQRQSSASSIASNSSTASSTSTISGTPAQTNGTSAAEPGSWAARKKATRGLWPPGKAEPATGLSTARAQTANSATSGPSASLAISALHAPMLPPQPMANGTAVTGGMRNQPPSELSAVLHLVPINGTFERKIITVPYYPDVLKIGRQTNQKTIPTSSNGYFDSKVLSRQHAEVYADRQGRIFIRDVKSSNGTFVNAVRLSPENKESEPREVREQDVLELGIDIVSEDQKTVVHHKVAAKVEYAGVYGQGQDVINFSDLDLGSGGSVGVGSNQPRRTGSQGSLNVRGSLSPAMPQQGEGVGLMNQSAQMRNWLNPITSESIVKRLNAEMKLAIQQSRDLKRARQSIEAMLSGKIEPAAKDKDVKAASDRHRPSPLKMKPDLNAQYSDPPAPPPSAPLPDKPDVARALADPIILPLLRRSDTARPPSNNTSPTKTDHSSDILRLCEELKLAKGELSSQSKRMRSLENELANERLARESAEERAARLEERRDSARDGSASDGGIDPRLAERQMDHGSRGVPNSKGGLHSSTDAMKHCMEAYRKRAETAEAERDQVKQTLAEMVQEKRKANAGQTHTSVQPTSNTHAASTQEPAFQTLEDTSPHHLNGQARSPTLPTSPTSHTLLERAGVEAGRPITPEQAKVLTQFLSQEVLGAQAQGQAFDHKSDKMTKYGGIEAASALSLVVMGWCLMRWLNAWEKIDR